MRELLSGARDTPNRSGDKTLRTPGPVSLAAQIQGLEVVVFGLFGLQAGDGGSYDIGQKSADAQAERAVFEAGVMEDGAREDEAEE